MRVRQLYQDELPAMYRRGMCPDGDLQQSRDDGGDVPNRPGGDLTMQPHAYLTIFLLLVSIFVLLH